MSRRSTKASWWDGVEVNATKAMRVEGLRTYAHDFLEKSQPWSLRLDKREAADSNRDFEGHGLTVLTS